MNFDNHNLWQIDHVRPVSSFDLSVDAQWDVCWNFRNLMPLLKDENQSKLDTYTKEDEALWLKRMRTLGYEGELFLIFN